MSNVLTPTISIALCCAPEGLRDADGRSPHFAPLQDRTGCKGSLLEPLPSRSLGQVFPSAFKKTGKGLFVVVRRWGVV